MAMDKLYNIFERERERVPDMTVFYNKNKNSLQYRNDEGTLTVLFKPEKAVEEFYYRRNDETEKVGFGNLIQTTREHGVYANMTPDIWDIPQEFINVAQAYQYDREAIGVEAQRSNPKPKHKSNANVERC